jgi:hypothetical protein
LKEKNKCSAKGYIVKKVKYPRKKGLFFKPSIDKQKKNVNEKHGKIQQGE